MGHILFICGVEHLLRAVQSPLLPSLQDLRTHSGVRAVGRVRTHRSLATSWGDMQSSQEIEVVHRV